MLFIFNPYTGGGRLRGKLMDILCYFAEEGCELTVCPTCAPGDARRYAREKAAAHDLVVCCGGDGTLNEVVHGLQQSGAQAPSLGYIPGGTTNDFAASLQLPRSNMMAAARRIMSPKKIYACDYGHFNSRVFTYVAACGAFTDVSYSTPQSFKNVLGYFAYILEAAQKLPSLHPVHMTVKSDEEEHEGDFLFGMVSNSTSVAGFSLLDKGKVQMDDGMFEVMLMRNPHNLNEFRKLSTAVLKHDAASPWVVSMQASRISITSQEPIPWTIDGEFGGAMTQVDVRAEHKGMRILV